MSKQSPIEMVKLPNTIDSLTADLRALGVREGDTLLVHASMSKIGWICGNEIAAVEALIRAVGEDGTIAMPAQTSDNSDPAEWRNPPVPAEWFDIIRENMPAFDRYATPTTYMGQIAEAFRTYPGTLRSDHPQVSFTARGKHALRITGRHALTPAFGMDTPLGALYELGAKILLLGVGYERCTALHLSETLAGAAEIARMGAAVIEDGNRVWKWFEDYDSDSGDFPAAGQAYEAGHPTRLGKVGCAECRLIDLPPLVDFGAHWLKQNRP